MDFRGMPRYLMEWKERALLISTQGIRRDFLLVRQPIAVLLLLFLSVGIMVRMVGWLALSFGNWPRSEICTLSNLRRNWKSKQKGGGRKRLAL